MPRCESRGVDTGAATKSQVEEKCAYENPHGMRVVVDEVTGKFPVNGAYFVGTDHFTAGFEDLKVSLNA